MQKNKKFVGTRFFNAISNAIRSKAGRLSMMVVLDLIAVSVSYWLSFLLRIDPSQLRTYLPLFANTLPLILVSHLPIFVAMGMYRHIWRYANIETAIFIGKSVFVSVSAFMCLYYLLPRAGLELPRSLPAIFALVSFTLLSALRICWRAIVNYKHQSDSQEKDTCFIYGAGSAGEFLAQHIARSPNFPYRAIGFIDDDRNKKGRLIQGLKIFGTGQDLKLLCSKHATRSVIVAIHNGRGDLMRSIITNCLEADAKPLIMPEIAASLSLDVFTPRPVDVKDLLRRFPKSIDIELVRSWFTGRVVFVSGAGGSIGSEICRQVCGFQPKKLLILDSSEFNLYRIDLELREIFGNTLEIVTVLGSVTDRNLVDDTFRVHRPSCVLHAAAYKHVPLVESNPITGILNNVLGTKILSEAAARHGVEKFLLISTDKAVRPTNIMGATKRCCELIIQHMQLRHGEACSFSSVRFGNVLGSSGSVIPRFLEQIQSGGPVTVTHPEVTRFFMLVDEAVGLVLQSISMSKGGETFVLNMGEPVKIFEMAKHFIRLAGKIPFQDIDVIFTGLRPGEKLYEELILEGSELRTLHEDVFVAIPNISESEASIVDVESLILNAQENRLQECLEIINRIIKRDFSASPPIEGANADFHLSLGHHHDSRMPTNCTEVI